MSYPRFGAMTATSTIVMFGLMHLNTYALDHVCYSRTWTWMALVMGAVMSVIVLLFVAGMYPSRRVNLGIIAGSVMVFAGALWLVRSQAAVSDVAYMKAKLPHHSIALLTSERAHIRDRRVRRLAEAIIEAHVREIGEMKRLIADLEQHLAGRGAPDLPPYDGRATASLPWSARHRGPRPTAAWPDALAAAPLRRLPARPASRPRPSWGRDQLRDRRSALATEAGICPSWRRCTKMCLVLLDTIRYGCPGLRRTQIGMAEQMPVRSDPGRIVERACGNGPDSRNSFEHQTDVRSAVAAEILISQRPDSSETCRYLHSVSSARATASVLKTVSVPKADPVRRWHQAQ